MFVALALQGCWSAPPPAKQESVPAKGSDVTIRPDAPPPKASIDLQESGLAKLPGDSRAYSNPSGDLAALENEKSKALPNASRSTPNVVVPPLLENDISKGHAWLKEPTMEETREEDKRRILGLGSDPTDIKPVEIKHPVIPVETKSSEVAENSSTLDALTRLTDADEVPAGRDAKPDSAESAESKKKVPAEDLAVHQDAAKHAEPEGTHPHDPLLAAEPVDTAPHPPHPVAAPTESVVFEDTDSLLESPPQTGFGSRKMGRHADLELEK